MKKILSVLLCAAMLLSIGAMTVSAAATVGTDVTYASKGTITVDGKLTGAAGAVEETALGLAHNLGNNVYMGASWGEDSDGVNRIYFAFATSIINDTNYATQTITGVTLTIGGKTATFAPNSTADCGIAGAEYAFNAAAIEKLGVNSYLEVSIPMLQLDFVQEGTEVYTPMTLEILGSRNENSTGSWLNAKGSFDGKLYFDADEVFMTYSPIGRVFNDGSTKGEWGNKSTPANFNGVRLLPTTAATENKSTYDVILSMKENIELEFQATCHITLPSNCGLPTAAETLSAAVNPSRVVFQLAKGPVTETVVNNQTQEHPTYTALLGIYNVSTEKGLALVRDKKGVSTPAAEDVIYLGKTSGSAFTLNVVWNADNSMAVTVDGALVGTFPAADSACFERTMGNKSYGLFARAFYGTNPAGAGTETIDVTVRNITLAKNKDLDAAAFMKLAGDVDFLGTQVTDVVDGKYDIRFNSYIATLEGAAGYLLKVTYNGTTSEQKDIPVNTVYSSIVAASETLTPPAGAWWMVFEVNNVPAVAGKDVTFEITPYTVAEGSTAKVLGETKTVVYTYNGTAAVPAA